MVGGAKLSGDRREPGDHFGFLSGPENAGLGIARDIARDSQRTIGSPSLGVDDPFRNSLTVLMRQFFDKLVVLQQNRSERTGGDRILIVGNWRSRRGC